MKIKFQDFESNIVAKAKTNYVPGMDWEDVAQELRIHLWLKRDKYKTGRGASVKTYTMRVLGNKIIDLKRQANRKKRTLDTHCLLFSQIDCNNPEILDLKIVRRIA